MAYNSKNEKTVELCKLQKNDSNNIIARKITNETTGTENIDIRMYWMDGDEEKPTQKGVRFNTENMLDFMKGMSAALMEDEVYDLIDFLQESLEAGDNEDMPAEE